MILKNLKISLQIAATYIGTVVGAGFATGKEIVEFFVRSGIWGFFGILLSSLFFIWIGIKMMQLSHRMSLQTYEQFNTFLFGPKLGKTINVLFMIILLFATAVMILGVGATFTEQLGLPGILGIGMVLGLSFYTLLKGMKGLFVVNSLIVPIMILFSFSLFLLTILHKGVSFPFTELGLHHLPHPFLNALLDCVLYASYNLVMAEVVLVPLGFVIKEERQIKWGGFLGGVGLSLILLSSYCVLIQIPNVALYNIPMAESVRPYGVFLHSLYILVVFGEIFSTVIGNLFGLTLQLNEWFKLPIKKLIVPLLIFCFLMSFFSFGSFLAIIYRIFGIIGLGIFFYLIFIPLPKKKQPFKWRPR